MHHQATISQSKIKDFCQPPLHKGAFGGHHPFTHVLVNDPTMGYGIFNENMLDAAT